LLSGQHRLLLRFDGGLVLHPPVVELTDDRPVDGLLARGEGPLSGGGLVELVSAFVERFEGGPLAVPDTVLPVQPTDPAFKFLLAGPMGSGRGACSSRTLAASMRGSSRPISRW
jgi:hypothetical protein